MKKILILLIVLSASSFPQNYLKLKNDAKFDDSKSKVVLLDGEKVRKNPGLAIIYSLLLPGMGELYAGDYSTGKYFTIADGALLASYFGMYSYATWKKNDYKTLAVKNAGISTRGKDDLYYGNISSYSNVQQFNNEKALEGSYKEMYDEKTFYWNWKSEEDRKNYRNLWVKSEQAYTNLRFFVGAMIINRIVSAINAVRLVSAYNKSLSNPITWNIGVDVTRQLDNSPQINFNFIKSF